MIDTSRTTILIVDDLKTNAISLQRILKEEWKTVIAHNGPTALEIANGPQRPDMILLDIRMPGMDGYEVCQKLKESTATRDIPVIFITAVDGEFEEAKGLELGAADFIVKPARPQVVKAQVRNQLALHRAMSELTQMNQKLERLAIRDELTGLYNRRKLDEEFDMEVTRAERYGRPLSVILFDLDHFKNVNDTYGHPIGDIVLAQTAAHLLQQLRSSDIAGRWGGEEFLIICPETGLDTAAMLADRLRQTQQELQLPQVKQVTASFGVAAHLPGQTAKDILLRVDEALYEAKRNGRNQVAKKEE